MAFSPITSWQIDEEKVEEVTDFIFLGCKLTADGDCSHEIKRYLLHGWKVRTNLDSTLNKQRQSTYALTKNKQIKRKKKKQRHHFADKDLYSQSYGFASSNVQSPNFHWKD